MALFPCSVLEPGRSLTLAEKGGEGAEMIIGAEGFRVLCTMNPGGDFGKKELSPALSNRFTQVRIHIDRSKGSGVKYRRRGGCALVCLLCDVEHIGHAVILSSCQARGLATHGLF